MAISLARVLLESGLLDVTWLGKATAIAAEANVPVSHALTRWKLLDAHALAQALSKATGLPVVDVATLAGPPVVPMQRVACQRLRVVPLKVEAGVLLLGMTDPTDDGVAKQIEEALQLRVKRCLVDDDALEACLRRLFHKPGEEIRAPFGGQPSTNAQWGAPAPAPAVDPDDLPTAQIRQPIAAPKSSTPIPSTPAPSSAPWGGLSSTTTATMPMPQKAPKEAEKKQEQNMAVVIAEPTAMDGSLPGLSPIPLSDFGAEGSDLFQLTPTKTPPAPPGLLSENHLRSFEGEVFGNNTVELAMVDMPPQQTVQMKLGSDPTVIGGATFDGPTLRNDVLSVVRVLIAVDDGAATSELVAAFTARVRELRVLGLDAALEELAQRQSFNVVVSVNPPNSIAGSQKVAALAQKAKHGVTVISRIADFGTLPGVRRVLDPGVNLIGTVEKLLFQESRDG